MSTVLARSDGTSTSFPNTQLGAILTSLEAAGNSYVEASGVAFRRLSANRLLLHDVNSTLGRKLLEMFTASYDSSQPFELAWSASGGTYDTQGAVNAAGFSGITVTVLANIHANTYFVGTPEQYLTSSNLVLSNGIFANQAATLKHLQATAPLTLTDDGSGILTLAGGASDPTYGSIVGGVTLTWSNTNRLIFQSPLAAVANGTDTEVTVTIPPTPNPSHGTQLGGITLSWATSDRILFGNGINAVSSGTDTIVSFNSTDYYTKSQVDSAIATAIAAIGGPIYSWPAGNQLYFNGSVSPSIQVNPSVANQTGSAITLALLSTTTWTISFDWNINSSQGNANHYVFAVNGVCSYNQAPSGQWLNGSSGYISLGSPAIVNGTWQSVKFTYDSTIGLKMYVDTTLIGTLSTSIVTMSGYAGKLTVSEDVGGGYDTVGYFRNFTVTNSVL